MVNAITTNASGELAKSRKFSVLRKRLKLRDKPPENVIFKLADTTDELAHVCKLLYDSYTQVGYMQKGGTGYRITPYYILPSCYTLIAKHGSTVIATATIIIKSREQIPVEQIFSLAPIQRWDRRIAEASSLTIDPNYRSQGGELIHALLKYMFQVAREDLGIHDLVMACTPKHMDFYEAVLLFRRLSEEVIESFDYVNGTTAAGGYLDLTTMHEDYAKAYGNEPGQRNVYKYYLEHRWECFQAVDRVSAAYDGNRWEPDQLDHFMHGPIQGATFLSTKDLELLRRHYPSSDYDELFAPYRLEKSSVLIDTSIATFVRHKSSVVTPVILRRIEEDRLYVTAEKPHHLLDAAELQIFPEDKSAAPIAITSIRLTGGSDVTLGCHSSPAPVISQKFGDASIGSFRIGLNAAGRIPVVHEEDLAHAG
ncbi:hypothetical protein PsAD2_04279 [Pseudovibrio axinellae]|uniref:N-acyl amino acid synthase FeeM catalytic core domain-containing protein n=1 Tax=Pseudovibrio axinellae TaxID=989403 RepID=A0A165T305_9HYPH|nr:GNAT family N-acetyltransferase [Pseudovibrio axinellae]KZL05354.1 hypothetical protein PsAD2_04279 [Pseudovibrio axinellae]SER84796.1 hypothetical protein SAMN05421798_1366 [Pseudovibrio axinellae]